MKDYFFSVLCASVVCALSTSVFSATKYEKYIKYISALIAAVIILSPLLKLIGYETEPLKGTITGYESMQFEKEDAEEMMYSFLQSNGKKALEDYFYNIISSESGIKPVSVSIFIEYKDGSAIIKSGEIVLENEDDIETVERFLNGNFGETEWKVS